MSILDFMEMSIIECIIGCICSFFICISFCSIGHLVIKGKNLALQTLIGMSIVSVIIVFFMSYFAIFAKYAIYVAICLSIPLSLYMLIKQWKNKKEILKSFLPVFFIFLYFSIRLFIWIIPKTNSFNFNNHETYFAAPALELFKAEYLSRLRLLDVYPFEWSKYHFFNSALTSIPLVAFIKKNYITFLFAKFLTISLLLGSIFGCIKEKYIYKKAVVYFIIGCTFAFLFSYNLVTWSSFTNNYSSLLLMCIVWLLIQEEDWKTSCIISLVLAVSTSRATLTGGFFFLYSLYNLFIREKQNNFFKFIIKEYKIAICCIISGLGTIVMLLSGKEPMGSVLSLDFMGNMFHYGWLEILPFGTFFTNLTLLPKEGVVYQMHFEFLVILVYIYIVFRNFEKVKLLFLNNYKIIIVITILMFELFFSYTLKVYGLNIKRYIFLMTSFICLYFLPLFTIKLLSEDKMNDLIILFIISSLMQYMIFNAGSSSCNYGLFVAPLIICITKQIIVDYNKQKNKKYIKVCTIIIGILGILYLFSYDFHYSFFADSEPNDVNYQKLLLQKVPYTKEAYCINSEEDADLAKLNAIKGNRVKYSFTPDIYNSIPTWMNNTSITLRFLPVNYKEYINSQWEN